MKKISLSGKIGANNADDYFSVFSKSSIFEGVGKNELYELFEASHLLELSEGELLLKEGDVSETFFIVYEGTLNVVKEDQEYHHEHILKIIHPGETIGEMALLDTAPRSASISAKTQAKVFVIPFIEFNRLAKKDVSFSNIFIKIARSVTQRLRQGNDLVTQALEKQLEEYKLRVAMGYFMMNVVAVVCLFTFALNGIVALMETVPSDTMITAPLVVIFLIVFLMIMKATGLPNETFGITTKNIKSSTIEGILFSLPICLLIVLVKWYLILYVPSYAGRPIIEPLAIVSPTIVNPYYQWGIWLLTFIVYGLFICPAEELIVRGGLQGCLDTFLTNKNKVFTSIFLSNLIFSTTHLYISLQLSLLAFFSGLFFGWLYSRNKNLIGVTISHCMLGIWSLCIIGLFHRTA